MAVQQTDIPETDVSETDIPETDIPETDVSETDVSAETPQRTQHEAALEKLFTRVSELSSLPAVAMQVIQIADDESSTADDLCAAVQSDPSLAVRVMRQVNSSYYTRRHRINDLKAAINVLGFREMRNLALTIYVSRMFSDAGTYRNYNREGLWGHLIAVATTAQMIAKVCGHVGPDEAYLAGLLHDMGLIVIDQHMRRNFREVLDAIDQETPTCVAERRVLTFDHSQLGGFVAERWNLPEGAVSAIRHHHAPDAAEPQHRDLVDIVEMGNYLCSRHGITSLGVHNVAPPSDAAIARLGISENQLSSIFEQLEETLEAADTLAAI
ncbi:MAG: HDOD domain-containing protein [Planctomycetes bacterium]|nr:HDOD domain-containing protein [Planctomycetota bacterium]